MLYLSFSSIFDILASSRILILVMIPNFYGELGKYLKYLVSSKRFQSNLLFMYLENDYGKDEYKEEIKWSWPSNIRIEC